MVSGKDVSRFPLQPQVDDAREDVQAVDHVGRDAAVQAVGGL